MRFPKSAHIIETGSVCRLEGIAEGKAEGRLSLIRKKMGKGKSVMQIADELEKTEKLRAKSAERLYTASKSGILSGGGAVIGTD